MRATSRGGDVAAVLAILIAANLLNNRLLPQAYVLTCLATAGLLLLARRDGCSWTEPGLGIRRMGPGLRWAAVLVAIVGVGYATAAQLPATRSGPRWGGPLRASPALRQPPCPICAALGPQRPGRPVLLGHARQPRLIAWRCRSRDGDAPGPWTHQSLTLKSPKIDRPSRSRGTDSFTI